MAVEPRLGSAGWDHRRVPPDDRLQQCSAPVLRDVGATTELHLQVSPWHGRDPDMCYVVHRASTVPSRPVWETYQVITKGGDAIALHPLPLEDTQTPGRGDHADLVIAIAGAVQDLAPMLLWQDRRDPTWPPCPAHPGRHPLRILNRRIVWEMRAGMPFVERDSGATWTYT
jgi:hypothetical protein